jgi:hypothetical protein
MRLKVCFKLKMKLKPGSKFVLVVRDHEAEESHENHETWKDEIENIMYKTTS